jgi:lipopolysaccharide cholinephosphotransferase
MGSRKLMNISLSNIQDAQLKKLQQLQYETVVELDKICRDNGIKYYIISGTLLGAVRHGGFIPWDDDLDIAMMRGDYDKFNDIAEKLLPEKYFLQNYRTDKFHCRPFTKIRINNTIFEESNISHLNCHKGVYIDIFPLDVVPESKFLRKLHKITLYCLDRAVMSKLKVLSVQNRTIFKIIMMWILYFIMYPFPRVWLGENLDRLMKKYNGSKSRFVSITLSSYGYDKQVLEQKIYGDPIDMLFNGYSLMAPEKWEKYLINLYDDYMKPPPLNKRVSRHNIIEIKI